MKQKGSIAISPQNRTVNMSILYQNSDLTQSSLLQYYKTSVLDELGFTLFKAYFTFEKKFQALQKTGAFFLLPT